MNDEINEVLSKMIPLSCKLNKEEEFILFFKIIKHLEFYYHYTLNDDILKKVIKKMEKKVTAVNKQKLISKFLHSWQGLKYLCIDNDKAWEYWLKIYKEYEEKLK